MEYTKLHSGMAGETYLIKMSEKRTVPFNGDWVVKAYKNMPDWIKSIELEARALSYLNENDMAVPGVVLWDVSLKEICQPFLVMERVGNQLLIDVIKEPEMRKMFSKLLYELHQIPLPEELKMHIEEDERRLISKEIEEIAELLNRYAQLKRLLPVVEWLCAHEDEVKDLKSAILHRDYHPWNVLVDENKNAKVIDWVWGAGDPRFDVAWTKSLLKRAGMIEVADAFIDYYESFLGGKMMNMDYFIVLSTLRWLANVLNSYLEIEDRESQQSIQFEVFFEPLKEGALEEIKNITGQKIDLSWEYLKQ